LKRILLSLALIIPICSQAQQHHEIGLTVGVANYYGDLQNKVFPSYGYKPMGGIFYKYFLSPHVGLRFGASYATVTAADSLSDIPVNQARNLSFESHIVEIHGGLEINFLPIDVDRMKVTPYIFGGVGAFYFNPYTQNNDGGRTFLRPLSTEGEGLAQYPDRKTYNNVAVSFPFGGGMKFLIGKTLVVTTELGFRYTTTDYLDDVSKSYVNPDTLLAYRGALSKALAYRGKSGTNAGHSVEYTNQRGDSKANDWFWYGSVGVAVYFRTFGNVKDYLQGRCPVFYSK
jgi:hypothetical protein